MKRTNPWRKTTKFDADCCALADRHYSRRKVGSPQFMPPGQTLVLRTELGDAVFGWWRPHPKSGIKLMSGRDGWTCTIFRNESGWRSSSLILAAEEMLRLHHPDGCGVDGMLTYVFSAKVASENPGYCYKKAGWRKIGMSADGKKVLLSKQFEMAGICPEA